MRCYKGKSFLDFMTIKENSGLKSIFGLQLKSVFHLLTHCMSVLASEGQI